FGDQVLKHAPDVLLDRANDVHQRLLGVDGNDVCRGKRQSRNSFDTLLDDHGVHIWLPPCDGLRRNNQLDDEIRWKTLREGVSASLPLPKPGWRPRQTRQQRSVIEPRNFILRITIGDNDETTARAAAVGAEPGALL